MAEYIQAITTLAHEEEAERIAKRLLTAKLAASVQIVPCRSLYRWRGKMEEASEWRLAIKTRRDLFPELAALIRAEHSYEVPEIFATTLVDATPDYWAWLHEELREKP